MKLRVSSATVALAAAMLWGQTASSPALESALKVLDRGAGLFAIYAARTGGTLAVVTELTPQAIQAGRWKNGADLEVTLANDAGESVGEARGRIGGESYSTVLTIPVSGAPARATVRVRDDRGTATDWVKLGSEPSRLVGDPIAYRASARAPARAVADFEFARRESITLQWPVLAALEKRDAQLLDHSGRAIPVDLPLAEAADHKTLTMAMGLSGFAPGDYVIELTANAHGVSDRKLLAIRVK